MFRPKVCLCIFLLIANVYHSFAFTERQANSADHTSYQYNQPLTLTSLSVPRSSLKPTPKKPQTVLRRKKEDKTRKKEHPRKKLLEEEPIHTQRAWLYSAVIPGLGQVYNKNYWKIPLIYGIFAGLAWGAIYNHMEYTTSRRELIEKYKSRQDVPKYSNLGNFIEGRKRDRTIFILAIGLWYLINVFDAYVGGSLKTFDVSDDLEIVIPLNKAKDTKLPEKK